MGNSTSISQLLRVPPGPVDLRSHDAAATPGFDGGKKEGRQAVAELAPRLADLQEKLFAAGYTGGTRQLLLLVQGMDTSGKGGVLKHCVAHFDPGGVRIRSFKAPTKKELAHDFLWRVEKEVPQAGYIGIFDRSHYEDVLVARVHGLAPIEEIERRYDAINAFEQDVAERGTTIVKCMLHISADEQKERLLARLDDPTKQWKYKPEDVDERARWPEYQTAYELALQRCNTEPAPWHVVPANRKWYRNWAVTSLLVEGLEGLDLGWPEPDYDVAAERRRVEAS
jgi:PPK2 family polyphosphate:nucleotide phosphotransferase